MGVEYRSRCAPRIRGVLERGAPTFRIFSFLVGDHAGTVDPFYRAGIRELSSVQKNRMFNGRVLHQKDLRVPTITLDRLLEDNGIRRLDLLSIDIEEAEPAALRGFDIERFSPKLVCIEASPSIRKYIGEYFTEHGYHRLERYLKDDRVSWYYAPVEPRH